MSGKHLPFLFIPDHGARLTPGDSHFLPMPFGQMRLSTGLVVLHCRTARQFLNNKSMITRMANGWSQPDVTKGAGIDDILIQTAVTHELRHNHDLLLSFSFLEGVRRSLFLGINMQIALRGYRPSRQKEFFPIPLLDWLTADICARREALLEFGDFYDGISTRDLPHYSIERLMSAGKDPSRMDPLFFCTLNALSNEVTFSSNPKEGEPSPVDIYELSAMCIQLISMIERYGFRAAMEISRTNIEGSYYSTLFGMLASFRDIAGGGRMNEHAVFMLGSTMCLAAICSGPPAAGTADFDCPSFRFCRLWSKLQDRKADLHRHIHDIDHLIELFAQLLHEPPIANRVAASTQYFEEVTNEAKAAWGTLPPGSEADSALRYWEDLLYMRKKLEHVALNDVPSHVRGLFGTRYASEIPLPPIILNCTDLDPTTCWIPAAQKFVDESAGKEFIQIFPSPKGALPRPVEAVEQINMVDKIDIIASKIFFDRDVSRSRTDQGKVLAALQRLLGQPALSLASLRGRSIELERLYRSRIHTGPA